MRWNKADGPSARVHFITYPINLAFPRVDRFQNWPSRSTKHIDYADPASHRHVDGNIQGNYRCLILLLVWLIFPRGLVQSWLDWYSLCAVHLLHFGMLSTFRQTKYFQKSVKILHMLIKNDKNPTQTYWKPTPNLAATGRFIHFGGRFKSW